MKKNLLTVLILALLIVNIALTAVMMISVSGTNKKTAALVETIATVMDLELTDQSKFQATTADVSMADTTVYSLDSMTIVLASESADEKTVHMVTEIALSLNTAHDDYETLGASVVNGDYAPIIKDVINTVIGAHTENFCRNNRDALKKEVLEAIQNKLGSDVVFDVAFSSVVFG